MLSSRPVKRPPVLALGALLAALGFASACSDTPSAPTANMSPVNAQEVAPAILSNYYGDIDFAATYPALTWKTPTKWMKGDTTVATFTVDPDYGALINFGSNHKLILPPNKICDPATSGYGPAFWDDWCELAHSNITFTIKSWTGSNGRPYATVVPDVRFKPYASYSARIYFYDANLVDFSKVVIPWCDKSNVCVDEGATDPFLLTYARKSYGPGYWVYRNLRHLSGYNVTAF
jgi:hypothetical protein